MRVLAHLISAGTLYHLNSCLITAVLKFSKNLLNMFYVTNHDASVFNYFLSQRSIDSRCLGAGCIYRSLRGHLVPAGTPCIQRNGHFKQWKQNLEGQKKCFKQNKFQQNHQQVSITKLFIYWMLKLYKKRTW